MKLLDYLPTSDAKHVSTYRAVLSNISKEGHFSTAKLTLTKSGSLEDVVRELTEQAACLNDSGSTMYGVVIEDLSPDVMDDEGTSPISIYRIKFSRSDLALAA